ncbi:MAG TPA: hypothetical protein VNG71_02240 [Pyrinomonadaceae bacterium]|nr:hypothetical protein [Pyrinomonadaceae bacterium]
MRCENAVRSTASKILAHLLLLPGSLLEHSVGPIAQRGEQTQYNRVNGSAPPNPVVGVASTIWTWKVYLPTELAHEIIRKAFTVFSAISKYTTVSTNSVSLSEVKALLEEWRDSSTELFLVMAAPPLFFVRAKGEVSEVRDAFFKFSSDNGTEAVILLTSALLALPTQPPKYAARWLSIRSNNVLIGVGESEFPADAFPDLASDLPF